MNNTSPFVFNGRIYYPGTVIKVKEIYKHLFKFNSMLRFTGYIISEKTYCFSSLHDGWEVYKLSNDQISKYFESILTEGIIKDDNKRTDPKYIDGIVSAWIWYILVMVFALFFKGAGNVIMTWCLATFIFFRWRNRKIKGG